VIVLVALGIFVWLGRAATRQAVPISAGWVVVLGAATLAVLVVAASALWRRTRFS
jgi:2-keto-4-pentenoate hydratase